MLYNMKKQFNFNGVLSRDEMRQVNGGQMPAPGTCGYQSGNGNIGMCGVSRAEAQAGSAANGGYWCCDSCPTTSYCAPLD
jgi:hypothetical protein